MKNKRDINIFIISVQKKQLHNTCCRIGYQRLSRGQPEATKRPRKGPLGCCWPQYFVIWPFAFITALSRSGMDLASFLNRFTSIPLTHSSWMALISFGREVMLESRFSLAFMILHRFSIGLRSSEFPGQSSTVKLFSWDLSRAMDFLLLWQGAESCKKDLQPCMRIQGNSFSSRTML